MRLPCLAVDYLLTLLGLHDADAILSREGVLAYGITGWKGTECLSIRNMPVSTRTEVKGVGLGSGGLINGVKQGIDASNALVTE